MVHVGLYHLFHFTDCLRTQNYLNRGRLRAWRVRGVLYSAHDIVALVLKYRISRIQPLLQFLLQEKEVSPPSQVEKLGKAQDKGGLLYCW